MGSSSGLGPALSRGDAVSSCQAVGGFFIDADVRSPTRSFAASSMRPGTRPSPRSRPTRRTIPARGQRRSARARSSSCRRNARGFAGTGANWWAFCFGRRLAPPCRAGLLDRRARRSPRRARRLSRCRGLRATGRRGAADRSRMGIRRARRAWRASNCLGDELHARRPLHGQLLAGRVSLAEFLSSDGYERTSPVNAYPRRSASAFTT